MSKIIFIIILIIFSPIIYKGLKKINYLYYNRNLLSDRKVEEKIKPFVLEALKKYQLSGYIPYQYENINFKKENDKLLIEVEVFILNKNELTKWNPVEKLISIKGYKIQNHYVIEDLIDTNSKDIGAIIPNNSNVPLNTLYRNRRWENHKQNWDLYKKDWDIKYLDEPI